MMRGIFPITITVYSLPHHYLLLKISDKKSHYHLPIIKLQDLR